jgi:hypothetical protein
MAHRTPVGPNAPPRDLASATDARTTRLHRTHQCRSSCTPLLTAHELPRPAISGVRDIVASTASHSNVRDDREPPLLWSGMARPNHIFRKNRSDLFFARGLDNPNQLESACEFRFCAHAISVVFEPAQGAAWRSIERICRDVGQISRRRGLINPWRPSVAQSRFGPKATEVLHRREMSP